MILKNLFIGALYGLGLIVVITLIVPWAVCLIDVYFDWCRQIQHYLR